MPKKLIWFVEFPTSQYKEDVKALARKADLRIIDAKFKKDFKEDEIAKEVPKLTKLSAKAQATEV